MLAVRLAHDFGGEVVSADSRQVYRGLDIGSGKDLSEYTVQDKQIPYHLIDLVGFEQEYSVFDYQRDFNATVPEILARGQVPVVCGGTGLYLEAILKGYSLRPVPEDPRLREELRELTDKDLQQRLLQLRPAQHNDTDLRDRARTVRAIEIALHSREREEETPAPLSALVLGIRWPRAVLRERIARRLRERLDQGLIEEVEHFSGMGCSWDRLESFGLEYRFVSQFLKGAIKNRNDLFQKLHTAIAQFAKRQETWFRRMERRGTPIHWIDLANLSDAEVLVEQYFERRNG